MPSAALTMHRATSTIIAARGGRDVRLTATQRQRRAPLASSVGSPLRAPATMARRETEAADETVEMKEVFAFFDEDMDGHLTVDEFVCVSPTEHASAKRSPGAEVPPAWTPPLALLRSQAVRSLGYAPTEDDVAVFERTVERRYDGSLNKTVFLNVMTGVVIPRLKKASPAAEEVPRAFRVSRARVCRTRVIRPPRGQHRCDCKPCPAVVSGGLQGGRRWHH